MALTIYGGNMPDRANDTAIAFADNVFAYQTWIDSTFVGELNNELDGINADLVTMSGYVVSATENKDAAEAAQTAAQAAQAAAENAANYTGEYSATTTYSIGEQTKYNGVFYRSLQNSNTGNTPDVENTWWEAVSGYPNYITKTSNYTAVNNDMVFADTSGGSFIVTLPAAPNDYDMVKIVDLTSSFATNPLSIARNGNNIMGLAEDMEVATDNISLTLMYVNNNWRLV